MTRARRRELVIILGALSAFGPLSMDMYLPGLPSLSRQLHASASAGQLTLTGCMLGIALGQLIAGPFSDSLGRRLPLLSGIAAYAIASAICAVAPSILMLIVLRFIQGLAGGVGVVIARAIVRDLFAGVTAARMFATLMIVTGVAPVFAPLIGGQVLEITSWRGIFGVLAAIGVPLWLITARRLPETLAPGARHGGGLRATVRTFGQLMADRRFAPHAISFSLSFGAMFAYIAGSSFVLENVFGASPQAFSLVFAVNSVGLITMSQVGSRLVSRRGAATLTRYGLCLVALASLSTLLVTATHGALAPLLVCLFALLCGNGLVLPNGVAAAMGDQTALGSASALLGLGQFGVGAAVAPLVGLAGSHDALPLGIVIGACGLSALLVDLLFAPR
ncbi:MAG TPA: multidrug effflux MFS transporter [Solirubrobacteraceae bacterium]|nr:multidrug effflux MFS transporter [Solirubrobacteraceae bacterium]